MDQRFLEIAHEQGRLSVNGIAISRQMGLSHDEYRRMIDRLEKAGHVSSKTSNAKDVVLTDKGIRQAKNG